jgi:putative membrane protein
VTMLFFAILLTVGLVVLVVTVVRVLLGGVASAPGRTTPRAGDSRARQILDERYAAGELSGQEYQHQRRVLREGK